mgnify:CR=1 FL=1
MKHKTEQQIITYLSSLDYIDFAILFGSYARGKELPMSDIDIAAGMGDKTLTLMQRGYIIAELESRIHIDVDLLVLNRLLHTNPALAYHIFQEGYMLFIRNQRMLTELKTEAMLRYLDTSHLRQQFNRPFLKEFA